MSEIRDGKDVCQWSRLEIKLNPFLRSIIPQKQLIFIIKCNEQVMNDQVLNLSTYVTENVQLKLMNLFFKQKIDLC